VHSEITRDENYNHHHANKVENVHLISSSRPTLGNLCSPANRAHYSMAVTGTPLHARPRPVGIPPVMMPVMIAIGSDPAAVGRPAVLIAPIGLMMTGVTACNHPKETAIGRLGRAG
jgi:hypothetical protein